MMELHRARRLRPIERGRGPREPVGQVLLEAVVEDGEARGAESGEQDGEAGLDPDGTSGRVDSRSSRRKKIKSVHRSPHGTRGALARLTGVGVCAHYQADVMWGLRLIKFGSHPVVGFTPFASRPRLS